MDFICACVCVFVCVEERRGERGGGIATVCWVAVGFVSALALVVVVVVFVVIVIISS